MGELFTLDIKEQRQEVEDDDNLDMWLQQTNKGRELAIFLE